MVDGNVNKALDTASPLGNGGRGLKHLIDKPVKTGQHASPLGNGGRGLKRFEAHLLAARYSRIAPWQRGAWIETFERLWRCHPGCLASPLGNGGRGLKLATGGSIAGGF